MLNKSNINMFTTVLITCIVVMAMSGCATTPAQLDNNHQDGQYGFSRAVVADDNKKWGPDFLAMRSNETLICPGDELQLNVLDVDDFKGTYIITAQGQLELPFLNSISASGLSALELTQKLENILVENEWFYEGSAHVSVSIVNLAPVQVMVSGAVFNPGRVTVNQKPANLPEQAIDQLAGDFDLGRDLTAALRAAGGIRPDADLSAVYLRRLGKAYRFDLSALLLGDQNLNTPPLMAGDQIFVRSTGIEDTQLIRPSQITPPGMRVYMSNLTAPVMSNASSAIGKDSTRLPYGTTLLESSVAANCVGGTQFANASRSVVLITRNYGDKSPVVIKRKIDDLLADASSVGINPYMMPNDAVACYDSKFTNFRDVARGFSEIFAPLFITGALL